MSERFTYDERSNLITQADARGVKTVYSYNSDPLNRLQSVSYDTSGFGDTGHPILAASGVSYEYMTSGDKTRLFRMTTAGVSTDEYGYDSEARVSSRTLTMTSRPLYPMVTDYIYDTLNRGTDVRYPAQYGMAGNPRKLVHHDYDVSSRLSKLQVAGIDYAKDIVYNAASQTTSLKVGANGANQITESYTYADTTGLLTNQKVQRGATSLMDLSYDYLRTGTTSGRTGQLTKILNNLNHSRDRGYVYDALGRLTTATGGQPASWTQQYVYDRYGNRTSVTATGTTGGTSLAAPTNLTTPSTTGDSITLNWTASLGADHYQIERHSAGNPAFQAIGTSTIPSYTDATVTPGAAYVYRVRAADAQSNLSGSSNARLGVAITFTDPTLLSGITLVKAAHVTELRQAVNAVQVLAGLPQASWTEAPLLGLQIRAVHIEELRTALTPALQALSLTVPGFTDAQLTGVIIKKLHIEELRLGVNASGAGDSGGGSSPIPVDGLASASYNPATNRINSTGWEYDAAGNQTRVQRRDGAWQRYVYDAAGRLVKVQNDSGITQIIHTYGASNHRLIEQVGTETSNQRTYYAWAGDSVIAEYEETAAAPTTPRWVKSYVYLGGRLLATIAPNGASERVEYHHPDRLGTRLVTNNQDTSSFEQVSLPFGRALDAESSGSTKRRFTSYDRSTVSGLDYAVNRHYDPLQGRFTQVDPIGMASSSLANPQTLNLYAYCANDPINHTDPSGLGFFSWLKRVFLKVVAALVAAVVAVLIVYVSGGNVAAALKVGWAVFKGALSASLGWQPSGGWGRTPPTSGSGPTLRQILGQTDLGRRLTPDRRLFLTPGINPYASVLGSTFQAQLSDCERFANMVQQIGNTAGNPDAFMDEMARTFTAANNSTIAEMQRAANLGLPAGRPRFGDSGFKPQFQDQSNQVRHFSAGLIAGYRLGSLPALLLMNQREHPNAGGVNNADIALNQVSTWFGANAIIPRQAIPYHGGVVPAEPGYGGLADVIRKRVCQ